MVLGVPILTHFRVKWVSSRDTQLDIEENIILQAFNTGFQQTHH